MKEIQLTKGLISIVDDEDFERLTKSSWCAEFRYNRFYARSRINNKAYYMHRIIMSAGVGEKIDHKNGNSLDNRKSNLRICTHTQNMWNCIKTKNSTSEYMGVSFCKRDNKFKAQICTHRKRKFLGRFNSEAEAARAYNEAALEQHGEFAKLNLI